jgi:hypothetical protein
VQVEEDNDVYARAFGGVWLNETSRSKARTTTSALRLGRSPTRLQSRIEGWSLGLLYEYGDARGPYNKIGWFTADIDGEIITVAGAAIQRFR